jgi:hypothetical protein
VDARIFVNEVGQTHSISQIPRLEIWGEQGILASSDAGDQETPILQVGKLYTGKLLVPQGGDFLSEKALLHAIPDRDINNGHGIFRQGLVHVRDISPTPDKGFETYRFEFRPYGGNDEMGTYFDTAYTATEIGARAVRDMIDFTPFLIDIDRPPDLLLSALNLTQTVMRAVVTGWELMATIALVGQDLLESLKPRRESSTKLRIYADLKPYQTGGLCPEVEVKITGAQLG